MLNRNLVPYNSVWTKLGVIKGLVCRGDRIVIPDSHLPREQGNMRNWVVELGHSDYLGLVATKRLLRQRIWFPDMDKKVESSNGEPLQLSTAPEELWQRLSCDHWGPTRDNKHLLVVIENLTRYPEVTVVNGTSADDNIHSFSEIFSQHKFLSYWVDRL